MSRSAVAAPDLTCSRCNSLVFVSIMCGKPSAASCAYAEILYELSCCVEGTAVALCPHLGFLRFSGTPQSKL
jgi:hypothetical protein